MHDLEQAMRGAMRAWGDLERDEEGHAGSMLACMTGTAPWMPGDMHACMHDLEQAMPA